MMSVRRLALAGLVGSLGVAACSFLAPLDGHQDAVGAEGDGAPTDANAGAESAAADASADVVGDGGAGASPYRDLVLADTPLAYWRMGIGAGQIVPDETANGNDLSLQGTGFELGAPGAIVGDSNGAVRFDGRTSWGIAEAPDALLFPAAASFTLECWALSEPVDGGSYFHTLAAHAADIGTTHVGYSLWLLPRPVSPDYARANFEWGTFDGGISATAPLSASRTFVHYVAVFDGTAARMYVDGTLGTVVPVPGGSSQRVSSFVVGARRPSKDLFAGVIDEVAVYGRALSVTDVVRHHEAGRGR
jgi:hypothetical protein